MEEKPCKPIILGIGPGEEETIKEQLIRAGIDVGSIEFVPKEDLEKFQNLQINIPKPFEIKTIDMIGDYRDGREKRRQRRKSDRK